MKTNTNIDKASKGGASAEKTATPAQPAKVDFALTERRKIIRPIPVPHTVESEGDTDWALFQELSNARRA
jgi:hypothetical protein